MAVGKSMNVDLVDQYVLTMIEDLVDQYLSDIIGVSNVPVHIRHYNRTYEITLTVPSGHMDDIDPIDLECFLASDPDVEEADVNLMVNVEEDNPFPDESSFVFQQMNMDCDDEDDDDLHEIVTDPYAVSVDPEEDEEDDVDAEFDEMAEDESDLYAAMSIREDDIPEEDRNEFADLGDYND